MIEKYINKVSAILQKHSVQNIDEKLALVRAEISQLTDKGTPAREALCILGDAEQVALQYLPQKPLTKSAIIASDCLTLIPTFLISSFSLLCIFGLGAIAGVSCLIYLVKSFTAFDSGTQKAAAFFITLLCLLVVALLFAIGIRLLKSVIMFAKQHFKKRKSKIKLLNLTASQTTKGQDNNDTTN